MFLLKYLFVRYDFNNKAKFNFPVPDRKIKKPMLMSFLPQNHPRGNYSD